MHKTSILDVADSLEERCTTLANRLITLYPVLVCEVNHVQGINSDLIVALFEKITNSAIPDLLLGENKEEEAHNVQAVIDTLSLDILGLSLSHITGEDVVGGSPVAIYNILEVLEGMALHLPSNNKENRNYSMKRKISRRRNSTNSSKLKLFHLGTELSELRENALKNEENGSSSANNIQFNSRQRHKFKPKMMKVNRPQDLCNINPVSSLDYPSSRATISIEKPSRVNNVLIRLKHELGPPEHTRKVVSDTCILSRTKSKATNGENEPDFHVEESVLNKFEDPGNTQKYVTSNIKRKVSKLSHRKAAILPFEEGQKVEDLYEKNLEKKVRVLLQRRSPYKSRASNLKKVYLQSMKQPIQRSSKSASSKSFLLPHTLRHRSLSHTSIKKRMSSKTQLFLNPSSQRVLKPHEGSKSGFMQELYGEFPGLLLSPTIVNHIRKKYQDSLLKMHKQVKGCLLKKSKSQIQSEEAAKKQSLISNILKKDIKQQQYMADYQRHKESENKIKYSLRDARLQSAKVKQYCDEFHEQMRKKLQKRNFAEELIFENLFKDAITIQRDQVERLCKEVKGTGESDAKEHKVYLDALENLHQTQFSMLSEMISAEKQDMEVREKAEKRAMNEMQRQFRDELKSEIRFMQNIILECMEDTHFRELDAEQYRDKLRKRFS